MSKVRGHYKLHTTNKGWFKKGVSSWRLGKGKPLEGKKECPVCHKMFNWKRSGYNKAPLTCSKECRYKSASITGTHHVFKECCVCGKTFGLPPSVMNDHGRLNSRMYCSRECRWKSRMRWTDNEKQNAERLVRTMVKQGIIIQKECEVCGDKNTIGHHYLGYDREHWLDIKWLCDKHHIREHERMRQAGENKLL
jgi:hypothetical protein